ncbi:MAG: CRTAC1 family protein [Chloroflexi bacterium]|nr:CRTAC1 family protein [Chloroflexota bacterium]
MRIGRSPLAMALLCMIVLPISGCGGAARTGSQVPRAARPGSAPGGRVPARSCFQDVTAAAGIHFRHQSGAAGQFHYPEPFGSGCVFLDYDGDGWEDIFLVNSGGGSCALYHNNRNGTFTDVTRQAGLSVSMHGMGACAGDFDNDGHEDLYVTDQAGPGHLFHNNGNGTFTDIAASAGVENRGHWATSCCWLDYDRDGLLDLFVCNYVRYRPDKDVVCRQGNQQIYCGPLVYPGDSCRLFHNEGHGHFRDVTKAAGLANLTGKSLGVAVWDFAGDGYPDLVVANDLTPNYLFRNNRNGTFTEVGVDAGVAYSADGTARSGMGVDVADVRNDGRCAILISNFAREPNSFFIQWGQPFLFSDQTYDAGMGEPSIQPLGFGLCFLDYDNDGWEDAFVANGHIQPGVASYEPGQRYAQRPLLFHNRGDGTFAEVGTACGGPLLDRIVGRGVACGDFDNDGREDLLVTSNNGPAMLWRNVTNNSNHWLALRLEGVKSNRDAIGAMVLVTAGGMTRRMMVRSGSSYLSQSDLRPHFGLGSATMAAVEIRWPSGLVQKIPSLGCDRIWQIREGSAATEWR